MISPNPSFLPFKVKVQEAVEKYLDCTKPEEPDSSDVQILICGAIMTLQSCGENAYVAIPAIKTLEIAVMHFPNDPIVPTVNQLITKLWSAVWAVEPRPESFVNMPEYLPSKPVDRTDYSMVRFIAFITEVQRALNDNDIVAKTTRVAPYAFRIDFESHDDQKRIVTPVYLLAETAYIRVLWFEQRNSSLCVVENIEGVSCW